MSGWVEIIVVSLLLSLGEWTCRCHYDTFQISASDYHISDRIRQRIHTKYYLMRSAEVKYYVSSYGYACRWGRRDTQVLVERREGTKVVWVCSNIEEGFCGVFSFPHNTNFKPFWRVFLTLYVYDYPPQYCLLHACYSMFMDKGTRSGHVSSRQISGEKREIQGENYNAIIDHSSSKLPPRVYCIALHWWVVQHVHPEQIQGLEIPFEADAENTKSWFFFSKAPVLMKLKGQCVTAAGRSCRNVAVSRPGPGVSLHLQSSAG